MKISLFPLSWPVGAALQSAVGLCLCLLALVSSATVNPPIIMADEAPRVRALLEQAWAIENGQAGIRHPPLLITLYCMAGRLGSAEAYYRAAQVVQRSARDAATRAQAAACFADAARLGHAAAFNALEKHPADPAIGSPCDAPATLQHFSAFNLDRHIELLPVVRKGYAQLLRKLARQYGIPVRLALAIALVESNFHAQALSPKEAMGIMQLIPETAARFAVLDPYDPEQNMRGGLAYLRWLKRRFDGDLVMIVAAYNAGEGAVIRYGGIPPYAETRDYVSRVLGYALHDLSLGLPPSALGREQ